MPVTDSNCHPEQCIYFLFNKNILLFLHTMTVFFFLSFFRVLHLLFLTQSVKVPRMMSTQVWCLGSLSGRGVLKRVGGCLEERHPPLIKEKRSPLSHSWKCTEHNSGVCWSEPFRRSSFQRVTHWLLIWFIQTAPADGLLMKRALCGLPVLNAYPWPCCRLVSGIDCSSTSAAILNTDC